MSCKCDNTLGNTGTPTCQPIMSVMKNIIVVPRFDSTGARNYIDLTATLNQAYFTGKVNESDPSKRWYPIRDIKNVTSEKGDSIIETFEDQSTVFIQEGVRSFAGLLAKQSPNYLKKIKDYRCTEIDIYVVDKEGNLIGMKTEEGKLFGIMVDNQSWNPTLAFGTDTTVQKILLAFNFEIDEKDENLEMITASDINPVNLLNLSGLLDVYSKVSGISTTGYTLTLTYSYGSVLNKGKVKGLVLADFISSVTATTAKVRNQTDSTDITISSVTETSDGVYVFVITPAQTSADVLIPFAKKNGFDFADLKLNTVVIP